MVFFTGGYRNEYWFLTLFALRFDWERGVKTSMLTPYYVRFDSLDKS